MTMRSVGFQLRSDGKAEVKNDFREVEKAANDTLESTASVAEQAGERIAKATEQATARQQAAWARQAQAAKLNAAGIAVNRTFDDAAAQRGNNGQFATVNLDRSTGAARASASVFQEAFAEQAAGEQAAAEAAKVAAAAEVEAKRAQDERVATVLKLRAAIDPLSVAQARYGAEVAAADQMLAAGDITLAEHTAALRLYADRLETTRKGLDDTSLAEERLAARTRAFVASIDPAAAAQQRFDREMAEARSLVSQGAIGLDQYCAKLRQQTAALHETEEAHGRMSTSGMILQHVMRSTVDSFSAGLPVTMILGEQISRLGEAAAYAGAENGGGKGKLAALAAFMGGPWGFAFTAAIGVAGALIPKLLDGADAADVMKEHQQQLASMIDQTTGRLLEQNKALLLNQAIVSAKDGAKARSSYEDIRTGFKQTAYSDEDIAHAVQRYMKGGSAAQLASDALAISVKKPWLKETTDVIIGQAAALTTYARTAGQAAAQQRILLGTARPGDQRVALGHFGPEKPDLSLVDAQAKLAAATTKSERAEAQATITRITARKAYDDGSISIDEYRKRMTAADVAVNGAHTHTDKHAASLARQAESMQVAARASLVLADAYLTSGSAAVEAEVRRKAATDATRKGIDVEAQVRRQLELQVAEGAATGAKAVAGLRDETAARSAILAQVQDGTLSVADMSRALSDEAALRPLLTLRTVAQGEALEALNRVIDAYRKGLDEAHKSEARFGLEKAIQDSKDRISEYQGATADLKHPPLIRAIDAANRAVNIEADNLGLQGENHTRLVKQREREAEEKYNADRAKYVRDALDGQRDALELAQRELDLVGASDTVRAAELDKLKAQQDIRRRFPDMAQSDVDQVLAGVAAQDAMNARLKLASATMDEMRQAGGQFLDDLLNPDGSGLKNLLKDVENEFIKLAALNPLKNLLLGQNNPTIGGLLGKLFGSSSGFTLDPSIANNGSTINTGVSLPHNASGTEDWSGGRTWVNENGPEIMDLPGGTRIIPNALSRQMVANDNSRGDTHVHVYAQDAVLADTVVGWVRQGMDVAATRGAAGGAQLSEANETARGARRLGRSWR